MQQGDLTGSIRKVYLVEKIPQTSATITSCYGNKEWLKVVSLI